MLALSRKCEERIPIGSGIELRVVAIHGNQVKLGVTAAHAIQILRTELLTPSLCSRNSLNAPPQPAAVAR